MKSFFYLFVGCCSIVSTAFGQYMPMADPAWFGTVATPAAASSVSYLIKQGFEGTGYDNGETWTEVNNPDENYTSVVLDGSQSLHIQSTDGTGKIAATTFHATGISEVWGYFLIRVASLPASSSEIVYLRPNTDSSTIARVKLTSTGALLIYNGTEATTVDTLSLDTTYHLWFHYKAGTGANSVMDVGFSSDGTKPTNGNRFASTSSGSATSSVGIIRLTAEGLAGYRTDWICDKVRIDDVSIGSSPQ